MFLVVLSVRYKLWQCLLVLSIFALERSPVASIGIFLVVYSNVKFTSCGLALWSPAGILKLHGTFSIAASNYDLDDWQPCIETLRWCSQAAQDLLRSSCHGQCLLVVYYDCDIYDLQPCLQTMC